MKKAPTLQVENISGDQFPDREAAQRAALPALAENFEAVIRELLERGELVNVNGTIIKNRRSANRPAHTCPGGQCQGVSTSRYDHNG